MICDQCNKKKRNDHKLGASDATYAKTKVISINIPKKKISTHNITLKKRNDDLCALVAYAVGGLVRMTTQLRIVRKCKLDSYALQRFHCPPHVPTTPITRTQNLSPQSLSPSHGTGGGPWVG